LFVVVAVVVVVIVVVVVVTVIVVVIVVVVDVKSFCVDIAFLEEVKNAIDNGPDAKRQRKMPTFMKKLKSACRDRGTTLEFMPHGMTNSRNSTRYIYK